MTSLIIILDCLEHILVSLVIMAFKAIQGLCTLVPPDCVVIDRARDCLSTTEPSDKITLSPFTLTTRATLNRTHMANAMLQILVPEANVHLAPVNVGALTLLQTINEVAVVLAAISPNLLALALPLALLKVSEDSHLLLREVVLPVSLELVDLKPTSVVTSILPQEVTLAMLMILLEFAFKPRGRLLPSLDAVAVELAVLPLALVAIPSLRLHKHTLPIALVVVVLADVALAAGPDGAPVALLKAVLPRALVNGSIFVLQHANTIESSSEISLSRLVLSLVDADITLMVLNENAAFPGLLFQVASIRLAQIGLPLCILDFQCRTILEKL